MNFLRSKEDDGNLSSASNSTGPFHFGYTELAKQNDAGVKL